MSSRVKSSTYKKGVIEPLSVKEQTVKSAVETASMILRIDDVIAATKPKEGEKAGVPGKEEGESEFE